MGTHLQTEWFVNCSKATSIFLSHQLSSDKSLCTDNWWFVSNCIDHFIKNHQVRELQTVIYYCIEEPESSESKLSALRYLQLRFPKYTHFPHFGGPHNFNFKKNKLLFCDTSFIDWKYMVNYIEYSQYFFIPYR